MRMDTSPLPTEIKRGYKFMFQWKKVLCFLTPVNVWVKSESACHLLGKKWQTKVRSEAPPGHMPPQSATFTQKEKTMFFES